MVMRMAPARDVSGLFIGDSPEQKKRTFQILWRASECAEMFRQINDKRENKRTTVGTAAVGGCRIAACCCE